MSDETGLPGDFYVESIYGQINQKGLVRISLNLKELCIITPSDARALALSILDAAAAAESDEAIIKTLEKAGYSKGQIIKHLRKVREARDKMEGEKSSGKPEDT